MKLQPRQWFTSRSRVSREELARLQQELAEERERSRQLESELIRARTAATEMDQSFRNWGKRNLTLDVDEQFRITLSMMKNLSDHSARLWQNIERLHDLSLRLKNSGRQVSEALGALSGVISATNQNVESGEAAVASTMQSVDHIMNTSRGILEAATLVNNIADRTTLLSLNASIEAARAGEFGRGFAVVATEISRLSELTNQSVLKIREFVDSSTKTARQGRQAEHGLTEIFSETKDGALGIASAYEQIQSVMLTQQQSMEEFFENMGVLGDVSADMKSEIKDNHKLLKLNLGALQEQIESRVKDFNERLERNAPGAGAGDMEI